MRRDLIPPALLLALLIAFLASAAGGANLITSNPALSHTPVAIGVPIDREYLRILNPTTAPGAVLCGPADQPQSAWLILRPGEDFEVGEKGDTDSSANEVIHCRLAATVTPTILLAVQEEGGGAMPNWTPTVTATSTNTPANTATNTPG